MTDEPTLADAPKGFRVKPLVWHKSHITPWDGDWHTVPTQYTIRCADENGWKWATNGGFGYALSDSEAKAAAQADYEARIMSSLELSPADDKDATIARLTRKLEWVRASRDHWLGAFEAEQSRAEQAEAKLAEAGTFAQGIEAAKAACRAVGMKYVLIPWAETVADDCEEAVAALSPTPLADPVREAMDNMMPGAIEALSAYEQADMDGIMVLVSRQAIEECLPALRALAQKEPSHD